MINKKYFSTVSCLFLGALLIPAPASSRVTTILGSMGVEQEYTSNVFHEQSHETTEWTTSLLPTVTVVSEGSSDSVELAVGSTLLWNQRLDERDFSHDFSVSFTKQMLQHLTMGLSADYVYYDDHPMQDFDDDLSYAQRFQRASLSVQEEVFRILFPEYGDYDVAQHYTLVLNEIEIRHAMASPSDQGRVDGLMSNSASRRRHWTSDFAFEAEYEFARDSSIRLGYAYSMLDNRSAEMSESYEHRPSVGLSYRFNPKWMASVDYEFTRSQYDLENDFTGNDTRVSVDYTLSASDRFSFSYGYSKSSYDGDGTDYNDQTGGLSWSHDFSNHLHLTSTVDANYLDREMGGDEAGGGISAHLTWDLPRGSVSVGAGLDSVEIKQNGSWEDVRESWTVDGAVSYELLQDLAATFDLSYEKRHEWSLLTDEGTLPADDPTFDDYGAGISLSYTFFRWYTVSLDYGFHKLVTHSSPVDDYQEHTVMLTFVASKDLFRW